MLTVTLLGLVLSGLGYHWQLFNQVTICVILAGGCIPLVLSVMYSIFNQTKWKE